MVGGQGTGSALAEALVEQSCDRIGVDAATELVLGTGVAYLGYGDVDPLRFQEVSECAAGRSRTDDQNVRLLYKHGF
jgi:hypothetical protein